MKSTFSASKGGYNRKSLTTTALTQSSTPHIWKQKQGEHHYHQSLRCECVCMHNHAKYSGTQNYINNRQNV